MVQKFRQQIRASTTMENLTLTFNMPLLLVRHISVVWVSRNHWQSMFSLSTEGYLISSRRLGWRSVLWKFPWCHRRILLHIRRWRWSNRVSCNHPTAAVPLLIFSSDPKYPDPNGGGYKGAEFCGNFAPTSAISTSYGYNEADLTPAYENRLCNE